MSVPASVAAAAESFRMNTHFLGKAVKDLSQEEWMLRPNDTSNHMLWIVGHVIWSRGAVLGRFGTTWSKPWFALFSRGAKLDESGAYPEPEEVANALHESGTLMAQAFHSITEEALDEAVTPPAPPSADGKNSGLVNFMAYHETYHVGQATYLRSWLGHGRLMG